MSENFDKIKVLRKQGLSLEEIAGETQLSGLTIQHYLGAMNRGFKSYLEYQEYLAKQMGFKSYLEYQEYLAKQSGFKSRYEYQEYLAKERGFKSVTEYQRYLVRKNGFNSIREYQVYLAKQSGFKSYYEYQEHLAKEKGFSSLTKYYEHLAKQNGFNSLTEYQRFIAKERQKRTLNKRFSKLINRQLKILDKNARWLADELSITEGAVSRYKDGKTTPRRSLQPKLFKILRLPYKNLEELEK